MTPELMFIIGFIIGMCLGAIVLGAGLVYWIKESKCSPN